MAGGLMQLVAYGAQDVYLTGNPKVTFFQAVYKRHTNFAMENIEQVVNGSASNSGRLSVTVARNGDLIGNMYLELTASGAVGAGTGNVWTAERAVQDVELTIGGQRIDKHYQKWWRLYAELYLDDAKKAEWGKVTTAAAASQKCVLPLIFFFNRNPGLYLPLIALQYHEVRLDIDLASDYQTFFGTDTPKVWGNYVYLDTEERRRFAQKGHEYLIEQVQHTGTDSLSAGSTTEQQIRLSYNHPVKELAWCLSNTQVTDKNSLWAFVDRPDQLTCTSNLAESVVVASNVAIEPHKSGAPFLIVDGTTGGKALDEKLAGTDAAAVAGPLSKFKLILNGQDRFKEQDGYYFNQVQPMCHHSGNPMAGVYSYSFALKPEEHQPTGTCNFSRIDNAQVAVTAKQGNANQLSMFAVNYNILKVQSGMGGLAFSN